MIVVCSSKGPQVMDFISESDKDKDLSALNWSLSKKDIVFESCSVFEESSNFASTLCREPVVASYYSVKNIISQSNTP